jgi:hypothetical protein
MRPPHETWWTQNPDPAARGEPRHWERVGGGTLNKSKSNVEVAGSFRGARWYYM